MNNIRPNTIPAESEKTRRTMESVGDWLVKDIQSYKMNEAAGNTDERIFFKSFSGATIYCMNSHVCPTIKRDPGKIILHYGTNDLHSKATPKDIAEEIVDLGNSMKTKANKIVISGDQWHNKAIEVNRFLKQLCVSQDIYYIDNTNIQAEYHLNGSRIHLNREGTRVLANNFLYALGYGQTKQPIVPNSSNPVTPAQSGESTHDAERLPLNTEMSAIPLDSSAARPLIADTHATEARSALKLLRIRNIGRVIIGYLDINSVRNKFDALKEFAAQSLDAYFCLPFDTEG